MTAEAPNGTRFIWALPPVVAAPHGTFDTSPPAPIVPQVETFYQNLNPPDSLYDSPVLFSITRQTAWRFKFTNDGQGYWTSAPLAAATMDYVEFIHPTTRQSYLLRIDDDGNHV